MADRYLKGIKRKNPNSNWMKGFVIPPPTLDELGRSQLESKLDITDSMRKRKVIR